MSKEKATELADPRTAKSGCQRPCCNKDPKKIPLWKVWVWSRQNPGVSPFRK